MTALSDAILADSPVIYIPGWEGSGTTLGDISGNSRNFTTTGSWSTTNRIVGPPSDPAIDWTGGYATRADEAAQRPTSITVETFVRVDSGTDRGIVMKSTNNSLADGYGIYIMSSGAGGALEFYVNNYNGSDTKARMSTPMSGYLGQWLHVVGTYDLTTIRLYVNGVEVASQPYTTAITHSTAALVLGNYPSSTPIDAAQAHTAIYASALSASRIAAHYVAASITGDVPITAALSCWYDPSRAAALSGSGVTQLPDLSGNRRFIIASGSLPTSSTAQFPSARRGLVFDGTDDWMGATGGTGTPTGTNAPDIADLLGTTDYAVACAFIPDSVATNSVDPSLNDAVWSNFGGHCGVYLRQSGSDVAVNYYLYDGAYRYPATGGFVVSPGEPVVVVASQSGTTGRLRVLTLDSDNEVTFTGGANTHGPAPSNALLELARPSSNSLYADIDLGEMLFYSTDPGDAGRASVANYLSSRWLRPRWDTARAAVTY